MYLFNIKKLIVKNILRLLKILYDIICHYDNFRHTNNSETAGYT